MRLNDRYPSVIRAIMGGNAFFSWYNSMTEPGSALAAIARHEYGSTLIWFIGLFGAVILLDVILNDWTPEKFRFGSLNFRIHWQKAFKQRHWLFVGCAVCYAAQPFVAQKGGYVVSLVGYFNWVAVTYIAVAYMDAADRSRSVGWEKTYS